MKKRTATVYRKVETKLNKLKIALVYDRVNKWGGAERVLLALHQIFPEAPLFTSVYDKNKAKWAGVFPKIYTSFLQNIPFAKGNHEFLAPLMALAFESFDFSSYDLVISVTSEFSKSIRTGVNTKHICYCLTPTRYLWSGYNTYFKSKSFLSLFGRILVPYLRRLDKTLAQRPDKIIAISSEVSKRIKKYYGRNAKIVFPPVNIPKYKTGSHKRKHFLVVSRLVSYKRVDLAIKVFNKIKHRLLIVGTGREYSNLKKISKSNIKFLGNVSENRLRKIYSESLGFIMPQEEDFGIAAIEAQSFGVPVLAFDKGGSKDTVLHKKTGILFSRQNIDSLHKAIKIFEKTNFNKKYIKSHAAGFSTIKFQKAFTKVAFE